MANKFTKKPLKKVQITAMSYYSRKDIQKAMFEFCKNRETVANHNNDFFAKRPDCFDYPNDIANSAKQGATSFHCSEELWEDPLKIKTDMTPKQYNEIKIGWDFLIDIDSPFLDYGKIAARLLTEQLEKHGIKNYGIKFSGGKGFHILVPFRAFPQEVNGEQTKDNFPEWPRLIAGYLFSKIREPMNKEILELTGREKLEKKGELKSEHLCPNCETPTIKKTIGTYECTDIRCRSKVESMKSNRKEMLCPSCNGKMVRISQREIMFCENCKINTAKMEAMSSYGGIKSKNTVQEFKIKDTIKSTEDAVDVVLVSSRHLFRAPYSLHEKTAFASIVIDKDEVQDFKPTDADPLKIRETKPFMPNCEPEEAKQLLLSSLEWGKENQPKEKPKQFSGEAIDLKGIKIDDSMFPPVIQKILSGISDDGRKRALSLLLSFYTSLEFPQEYIEEKIEEWNQKNYTPLKQGYIKSQVVWHIKNKRLPPNYDKPIYKEFGINRPPKPGIKNPVVYTIKMAFKKKKRLDRK